MSLPEISIYDLPDPVREHLPDLFVNEVYDLDMAVILALGGWIVAGGVFLLACLHDRRRVMKARLEVAQASLASAGGDGNASLAAGRPPLLTSSVLVGVLWLFCVVGIVTGFQIHKDGLIKTRHVEVELIQAENSFQRRMEQSSKVRELLARELKMPIIDESRRAAFVHATEALPKGLVRIYEDPAVKDRADLLNWVQQMRELLLAAGYSDVSPWEGMCGMGISSGTYTPVAGVKPPAGMASYIPPLLDALSAAGLSAWDSVEVLESFDVAMVVIRVPRLPDEPAPVVEKARDASNPDPFAN